MGRQWLILAIVAQLTGLAVGGAVVQVYFLSYSNSAEKDWDNDYCDPGGIGKCDHKFVFCFDKTIGSVDNRFEPQYCRIQQYSTSEYQDKNGITFDTHMNGMHNPTHDVIPVWEQSFRMKVRVMDDDHGKDDLVDKLYKTFTMNRPFRSLEESQWVRPDNDVILGTRKRNPTSLLLDWKVYCETDYYSANCSVRCLAQNGAGGHYTCDPDTGEKFCREGWESPADDCTIMSDDCYQNECKNGATCVDGARTYTCDCPTGFIGSRCETDIDECAVNPCQNGATCQDGAGNYTCQCSGNYTGRDCDLHVCHSSVSPCQNGGTCYNSGQCLCPRGFIGLACETEICGTSLTCVHGGTCSEGACQCPTGYYSNDCGLDICLLISCLNGGTCSQAAHGCECPDAYQGDRCQIEVNECESNPCQHEGTCENEIDSYVCRCLPGYSGVNCQTRITAPVSEIITVTVLDNDVTPAGVKQVGVDDPDPTSFPAWALGLLILLGILVLIIILIVALLMKYRRRLSRAKHEAAVAQGAAGAGNFANPLYSPEHNHSQLQNSANENRSAGGAVGLSVEDHVYANPGALEFKYPPSPLNIGSTGNHYDTPSKLAGMDHTDTPPAYTPSEIGSTGGAFAGVLDEEAPALPEKKGGH